MYGEALVKAIGAPLDGSYGTLPGTDSEGSARIVEMAKAAGFDGTSTYVPESYDAAALMLLAMQAAGSSASADFKGKIEEVANAPGEKIYPGDLAKAIELIKAGTDIDYVGATNVELIGPGESAGSFREYTIKDGQFVTDRFR